MGAPYGGPSGRGSVYIFHGSRQGIRKEFSQVIHAEDVSSIYNPIETFGFSISGGLDLDRNDYPDMLVGSYLSDTAHFFRSRPVVNVQTHLRFLQPHNLIALDRPNCRLSDGKNVVCSKIEFCASYNGIGIPDTIDLNIQFLLDSHKQKDPRMFFRMYEKKNMLNQTWTLRKDSREECRELDVYIKDEVRDKLSLLIADVSYSMKDKRQVQYQQRDPRATLYPVLDFSTPPLRTANISIQKECGADNVCIPDLHLIVNS